jgi:CheY-like chemotaxis protein
MVRHFTPEKWAETLLQFKGAQTMKMKLMIVEDNLQVRKMMRSLLDDLVDEFVDCSDGSEALASYTEHHPDLVLMDIEMNEMDGFDATKEIKAAFPAARVFIVSQWDTSALREAAALSGAEGYVNKSGLLSIRDVIEDMSN